MSLYVVCIQKQMKKHRKTTTKITQKLKKKKTNTQRLYHKKIHKIISA